MTLDAGLSRVCYTHKIMDHGRQVSPEYNPPLTFKSNRYSKFLWITVYFCGLVHTLILKVVFYMIVVLFNTILNIRTLVISRAGVTSNKKIKSLFYN